MSAKETIDKAYGNVPKEVGFSDHSLFDWLPTPRGIKYYWLKVVRFFTR